jgi:hypothetical protein
MPFVFLVTKLLPLSSQIPPFKNDGETPLPLVNISDNLKLEGFDLTNECWLFHGTSKDVAIGYISEVGFQCSSYVILSSRSLSPSPSSILER